MSQRFEVFWDWTTGGNVTHIAEHGVSPEEVNEVLERGFDRRRLNRGDAQWIVRHYTNGGRYLAVPFDLEWIDELGGWLVTPRSAFEPNEAY